MRSPPPIDRRTAAHVGEQIRKLLAVYAPEGQGAASDPVGAALIAVFARYAEIVIDRLNRAPQKNLIAFLDLLGASLLPPQPARAPLTFSISPGGGRAVVPAGTQVAAEGPAGPVIFETEQELILTTATLDALMVHDPLEDRYANLGSLLLESATPGAAVFQGRQPIERYFALGSTNLADFRGLTRLVVKFELEAPISNADARTLRWEIWDGREGHPIEPNTDSTKCLTQDGEVVFENPPPFSRHAVAGRDSGWLRCRLLTPVTNATGKADGKVRAGHLPRIRTVTLRVDADRAGVALDAAFFNTSAVDPTKTFLPFGERPQPGDTLYLASAEAFSRKGVTTQLTFDAAPGANPNPSADLAFLCEAWNGQGWSELTSTWEQWDDGKKSWAVQDAKAAAKALSARKIRVNLSLRAAPAVKSVNGIESRWIRLRIASGNYGTDAGFRLKTEGKREDGYVVEPATLRPPRLDSLTLDYAIRGEAVGVTEVVACNDPALEEWTGQPFAPFGAEMETEPAFYLGFALAAGQANFSTDPVTLHLMVVAPSPSGLRLAWEYWNGGAWLDASVRDETEALTRSGSVTFVPPADFAPRTAFGRLRHWLRCRAVGAPSPIDVKLTRVLLNTTMASQSETICNELLGSSDGSASQVFGTARTPVLSGQVLEVRELEMPRLPAGKLQPPDEGVGDRPTPGTRDAWVAWREVPDFYASGPSDRHYVIDHVRGTIVFGDGRSGSIPPRGSGNIRLACYRTGGGGAGNRPAGTIVQLKSTAPYVTRVTNPIAAAGGADAEALAALVERAPRTVRHGGRAVTFEDYQDLALAASPEVARAKCLSPRNLGDKNLPGNPAPGDVRVIIVPHSTEAKPLPSPELKDRAVEHLRRHCHAGAKIAVFGSPYKRVDIIAEVALLSLGGADLVLKAIQTRLAAYLNPLTGGASSAGWAFGREPRLSDVIALIANVAGVDHVQSLTVESCWDSETDKAAGAELGCFLVRPGDLKITPAIGARA